MLLDLDSPRPVPNEFDVCVAGGGAAGVTLALELMGSGARVCLLEAGGLHPESRSQDVYRGRCEAPLADGYLDGSRLRFLGGTTNHWVGAWMPLDRVDLESRPWVSESGWPLRWEELEPYYRRAAARFGLREHLLGKNLLTPPSARAFPGLPPALEVKPWILQPTRFGPDLLPQLEAADDVVVLLNANLVHVGLAAHGASIERFEVASYDGRRHAIRARQYVLALGALENARMLLASSDVAKEGIGNRHDCVGRYFMEHPVFPIGEISGTSEISVLDEVEPETRVLRLSDEEQRRRRLLNCNLAFNLVPQVEDVRDQLLRDIPWRRLEPFLRQHPVRAGAEKGRAAGPALHHLPAFTFRPEVPPVAESRVILDATERDQFGLPRLHLHWKIPPDVARSILDTARLIGRELGRLGIGRLRVDVSALRQRVLSPGFHQMGTTRAAEDPRRGVVDAHCRVHGIDNLHVAGSSVFPTGGAANPTYTLIALAIRLADRLKQSLDLAL